MKKLSNMTIDPNAPLIDTILDKDLQKKLVMLKTDPVYFARAFFKHPKHSNKPFEPYDYQIKILRAASKKSRVLVNSSRQIGKTELATILAAWFAFTHENVLVLIASKSLRQSVNLLRRTKTKILVSDLRTDVIQSSQTSITLKNNSQIIAAPDSPDTIRGYAADLVIIDEASHFPDDKIYYEVIKPMVMHTHGKIVIISTPGGRRGFFYDEHEKWYRRSEGDPNSDFDVFDLPAVLNGKPICPDFTMEQINEERRTMPDVIFRQEYMAEFISVKNAFFPPTITRPCVHDYEQLHKGEPEGTYYMGIDWGQARDRTVVVIGSTIKIGNKDANNAYKK